MRSQATSLRMMMARTIMVSTIGRPRAIAVEAVAQHNGPQRLAVGRLAEERFQNRMELELIVRDNRDVDCPQSLTFRSSGERACGRGRTATRPSRRKNSLALHSNGLVKEFQEDAPAIGSVSTASRPNWTRTDA
jgi:hypothetical protein